MQIKARSLLSLVGTGKILTHRKNRVDLRGAASYGFARGWLSHVKRGCFRPDKYCDRAQVFRKGNRPPGGLEWGTT